MSGSGHAKRAIFAAFAANLGIAVAKFIGFLLTRSSSLLAESVHSLADTGNQGLLLLGDHRARRAPDVSHPFGYGRERYFWAFVVALVLFIGGAAFAIYEGIAKIRHPHAIESAPIAMGILVVAMVLEGGSFATAVKEASAVRRGRSLVRYIRESQAPELPVVLLEAVEMKSLLIGESALVEDTVAIERVLAEDPKVEAVIHLRTQHLGPEDLLVAAKPAFDPALTLPELALAIDAAEVRVRAEVPTVRLIYIEPDLHRNR